MGKDKGYSGDVRILDWMIFKHRRTFQHLRDVHIYWGYILGRK
jgi:hypothetical protein